MSLYKQARASCASDGAISGSGFGWKKCVMLFILMGLFYNFSRQLRSVIVIVKYPEFDLLFWTSIVDFLVGLAGLIFCLLLVVYNKRLFAGVLAFLYALSFCSVLFLKVDPSGEVIGKSYLYVLVSLRLLDVVLMFLGRFDEILLKPVLFVEFLLPMVFFLYLCATDLGRSYKSQ